LWSNFVVEPLNISTHRAQEFIHKKTARAPVARRLEH
jgi:hypothetical protein